jgi:asparagine synthase (glutamine-hydrolysing)
MCGIAGLFLPRGAGHIEADIDSMLTVMRHRGPNGRARYVAPDRRYQCGFARLAIIDLTTGDQPIIEAEGARVLMGNGEIYNYRELRAEEPGYPYRTQGDMEVVLPLASRHGDDFVQRLNGMYGLALYERDKHRLTLVRDRLGIKPIYWTKVRNGGILFASEPKGLFASGLVAPAVDELAVSSYLAHGYVPAPLTLYAGVRKLAPGHRLIVEADGNIKEEAYWRPRPTATVPTADELLELMQDAVRLQLRSDVPVGALLSGGLDSGMIVALAARSLDRPLNTYTVRFEGAAYDETPLAAAIAARYGTNHTEFTLPASGIMKHLPALAWHADEPLADASLLPNQLIEAELAKHVTVVLNGTGGDEIFAGYGRYFPLRVERKYLRLPGMARRLIERLAPPLRAWQLARAAKFRNDPGGYVHDHACHFPPPYRGLIGNRQAIPDPAQRAALGDFAGHSQTACLIADIGTYLPDDLLCLLDRTSMASSVEGRVPLLDHRLVEAALAVPPGLRTPGGKQKGLERAIAAAYLPEAVLNAPKQGFASPVPAWMKAGLGDAARPLLLRPSSLARGWWSREGIEALLQDSDKHAFRIYSLIMLEMAIRTHIEGQRGDNLEDFLDAC